MNYENRTNKSITVFLFQLSCLLCVIIVSQLTTFNGMAELAHITAAFQSQVL